MQKTLRRRSCLGLAVLLAWSAGGAGAQGSGISLARVLADTMEREGFEPAAVAETVAAIRRHRASDPGAYDIDEDELHELWDELLVAGRLDAALATAALRVDEFPDSHAGHRALGETYAALGREEDARSSYAAAQEVNRGSSPREQWARQHVANLLAGKKSLERELEIAARRIADEEGDADQHLERAAMDYRKRPEDFFVDERALSALGYELLEADRIDDATIVFGLNARAFPDSFNAYQNLGEAYLAQGAVRRAIESYQRSLALRPQNAGGVRRLEQIREEMYLLPYPEGESYFLLQGPHGPFGHQGPAAYAFDFRMPIGTPVFAARGGEVVAVESRFEDGTRKPGEENYIFVKHSDGTFGRYFHLKKAGAVVVEGDRVERGQRLGDSGDSGASAGAHLHFDVTVECPEWGCRTIPIAFANAVENPLATGELYKALPMPAAAETGLPEPR